MPVPLDVLQRRRERAADAILGDERLRAHLADDEAQPLLDWAVAWADAHARATAAIAADDRAAQAIALGLDRLRAQLQMLDLVIGCRQDDDAGTLVMLLADLAASLPSPALAEQTEHLAAAARRMSGPELARDIVVLLPPAPR
ncbi:MAG: hypothetical protein HYY04_01810 [Chloroflexi bacterium]|nr:hypothetical protein [Chloroflexota bacterium]